ncbi:hypothetical protein E2562_024083 [Oryza meyeriana var. granulata]|uniref:Uncharacterized protein n=1 Tax=Oryza meyeriana var. granulata TaxID=110450 RepID=A0A6G1CHZ9_9ORYZ|nr:hypothetical protein E2562_024083 [Oryza meyeriana var. granulata]
MEEDKPRAPACPGMEDKVRVEVVVDEACARRRTRWAERRAVTGVSWLGGGGVLAWWEMFCPQ